MSTDTDTAPAEKADVVSAIRQGVTGTALLVGALASLTLALLQWSLQDGLKDFVNGNVLPKPQRLLALRLTLGVAGATALGALIFAVVKRASAAPRLLRWGKLLSPLLVSVFVPSLYFRGAWKGPLELPYLVVLAVAGLLLEQLLAVSLAELRPFRLDSQRFERVRRVLRWVPAALVTAGIIYYAVLIGRYTLITHIGMWTSTTDLGEYDNQFFNSLHGHPFRLPASEGNLKDWSALKFHADFIIYVLLPFYAIKPGPESLLIIQTVLVAFTALPIYLFGARRLPRWIAAVVALCFLLLPVIQRPNFYDFHAVPIGMFFIAWAILFLDRILHAERALRRDYVGFWLSFALALASREDIAFGMVVISTFLLFYGKRLRLVATMLVLSISYFVVIKFVIMPRIGEVWYHAIYDDLKAQGFRNYGAVVASMLTNPVFVLRSMVKEPKLLYVLHMTVPLLCLWIRRPVLLVAALPAVFFTLMVTNRPPMYQTSFQYAFGWFPYIVTASILALEGMGKVAGARRQAAAALALILVATGAGFQYGLLLGGKTIIGGFGEKRVTVSPEELRRYRELKRLVAHIPPEASVTATAGEGAHVSTRLILYNLGYGLGDKPDFILFHKSLSKGEAQRVIPVVENGEYGLVEERDVFMLLKRGHDIGKNPQVLEVLRQR